MSFPFALSENKGDPKGDRRKVTSSGLLKAQYRLGNMEESSGGQKTKESGREVMPVGRRRTVGDGKSKDSGEEKAGVGGCLWLGLCTDKGTLFSIGPCKPVHTATVTGSNKTLCKRMNHSLLLHSWL